MLPAYSVEIIGNARERHVHLRGPGKRVVIGLVERGGKTRFVHVEHATKESVRDVVVRNVSRQGALHTDESRLYTTLGQEFGSHAPCAMPAANTSVTKMTG